MIILRRRGKIRGGYGGIDLLKILSCIGVLAYHVLDDTFAFEKGITASRILYHLVSYCVPMFFTVSGFTYGNSSFSPEYTEKRIIGTLKKLFGWIIFWCVVFFFICGEKYNPITEFLNGVSSEGILPVSWFIFTICFCWLFGYFACAVRAKNRIIFDLAVLALIAFMIIKRSFNFIPSIPLYDTKTQTTWLGLYFTFFLIGMLANDLKDLIIRANLIYKITTLTVLIAVTVIYLKLSVPTFKMPYTIYGNWIYMIWFFLLFVVCMSVCPYSDFLHRISKGTFSVYLWHLPVLLFITKYYQIKNAYIGIMVIVFLFVSGEIIYNIFERVPLLRKIV